MRLIDADGLKKSIEEDENLKDNSLAYLLMNLMTCYIDDSITIDAEPVRHGHWDSNGCCTSCGECAVRTEWDTPVYDHWNGISRLSHFDHHVDTVKTDYCPHCGAKMDEEDNT